MDDATERGPKTPAELHKEREDAREAALVAAGEPVSACQGRCYGARAVANPPRLLIRLTVYGAEAFATKDFLPEVMLPGDVWEVLVADAEAHRVTPEHLRSLWLRLCHPDDVSVGTVPVKKACLEFDPQHRRMLRRLLLVRAAGHARLLFEEFLKWVFEVCTWDFGRLLLNSFKVVKDAQAVNVPLARAVLRYVHDGAEPGEFDRTVLGLLAPDEGLGPWHSPVALVALAMRYPGLAHPLLAMQRSLQKRFLGRAHWQRSMEEAGTALFPAVWTAAHARVMAARVLMLETVSTEATPFAYGLPGSQVAPPPELMGAAGQAGVPPSAAGGAQRGASSRRADGAAEAGRQQGSAGAGAGGGEAARGAARGGSGEEEEEEAEEEAEEEGGGRPWAAAAAAGCWGGGCWRCRRRGAAAAPPPRCLSQLHCLNGLWGGGRGRSGGARAGPQRARCRACCRPH